MGSRPDAIDRHVGRRVRERRLLLGMSAEALAEAISVTCQQVNKYETAINRIAVGRLYDIACVLGVSIDWFYDGMDDGQSSAEFNRLHFELARSFRSAAPRDQRILADLAAAMAER